MSEVSSGVRHGKRYWMSRAVLLGKPNARWDEGTEYWWKTEGCGRSVDRPQLTENASTANKILSIKWLCLHKRMAAQALIYLGSGPSAQPARHTLFSQLPRPSTMDKESKQQKRRENALSLLDAAIEAMNLAKEVSSPTPAKAIFGSVSVLLRMIRVRLLSSTKVAFGFTCIQDSMGNKTDYIELGLACAEICEALKQETNGRKLEDLSQSVRDAIAQLKMCAKLMTRGFDNSLMHALDRRTVDKIHEKVSEKGERNRFSRALQAKSDKDTIAAWKSDLNRILQVFTVRLITCVRSSLTVRFQAQVAVNTNVIVSEIRSAVVNGREEANNTNSLVSTACTPFIVERTLTVV